MSEPKNMGLLVYAATGPGILHQMTGVIAGHRANITSVSIVEQGQEEDRVYFEIDMPVDVEHLAADMRALDVVHRVDVVQSLEKIYGKRIIIMGGGAQVGQVAI